MFSEFMGQGFKQLVIEPILGLFDTEKGGWRRIFKEQKVGEDL